MNPSPMSIHTGKPQLLFSLLMPPSCPVYPLLAPPPPPPLRPHRAVSTAEPHNGSVSDLLLAVFESFFACCSPPLVILARCRPSQPSAALLTRFRASQFLSGPPPVGAGSELRMPRKAQPPPSAIRCWVRRGIGGWSLVPPPPILLGVPCLSVVFQPGAQSSTPAHSTECAGP